jgi:hypothetical protein
MVRDGEIGADVNRSLWRIGWSWPYVFVGVPIIGIGLGYLLGGGLGFAAGLLGLAGGPVFAISGLTYVHLRKTGVIRNGVAVVEREVAATVRLDDDAETHSLLSAEGSSAPLLPKPTARVTTVILGENVFLVHDDAEIRLPGATWRVGDDTNEFHYDRVTGASYDPDESDDGGTFSVTLSDGRDRSWDTVTDADGTLRSVRRRIQAHGGE